MRSLIGFNDTDNMFFACPLNTNSNLSNSIYNEWPCKYLYHYLYTTEILHGTAIFLMNSQLNVLLLCGLILIETRYSIYFLTKIKCQEELNYKNLIPIIILYYQSVGFLCNNNCGMLKWFIANNEISTSFPSSVFVFIHLCPRSIHTKSRIKLKL